MFCGLFSKPDVSFYLFEDAEVLVSRKGDLDLDTMKQMQGIYDKMSDRWDFVRVRTDAAPDRVARKAMGQGSSRIIAARRR